MTDASSRYAAAVRKGLGPQVQAVEAARARLSDHINQMDREVRIQVRSSVQNTTWKVLVAAMGIGAAIFARQGMTTLWKAVIKTDPPDNPADPDTSWPEALGWTVATGVGVGVFRLLANRGAAAGWTKAVGELPPPLRKGDPQVKGVA